MNKPLPTMQEVAADAEFQLIAAACQLNWLTALALAIQLDHSHGAGRHAAHLAEIVKHFSDTGFCGIRSEIDEFKHLSESAPQNADMPIRGATSNSIRVPLSDFAVGRHAATAKLLGMTQGSLSKAIREGRSIFVTGNAVEGYQAFEEKSFPAQRRPTEAGQ